MTRWPRYGLCRAALLKSTTLQAGGGLQAGHAALSTCTRQVPTGRRPLPVPSCPSCQLAAHPCLTQLKARAAVDGLQHLFAQRGCPPVVGQLQGAPAGVGGCGGSGARRLGACRRGVGIRQAARCQACSLSSAPASCRAHLEQVVAGGGGGQPVHVSAPQGRQRRGGAGHLLHRQRRLEVLEATQGGPAGAGDEPGVREKGKAGTARRGGGL